MKVWAKILNGDKILKDIVYDDGRSLSNDNFLKLLQEVSYPLDISVPVTLPAHFKHFEKFNRVKYLPRDFIEEVEFTSFVIERIPEEKKNKLYAHN